jgi:hypothetical protein
MPAPAFPDALGRANLLNCHHNLHGVQAVKTEVVGEVRGGRELRGLLATSFAAEAIAIIVLSKGRRPVICMLVYHSKPSVPHVIQCAPCRSS